MTPVECQECGHQFRVQPALLNADVRCPHCRHVTPAVPFMKVEDDPDTGVDSLFSPVPLPGPPVPLALEGPSVTEHPQVVPPPRVSSMPPRYGHPGPSLSWGVAYGHGHGHGHGLPPKRAGRSWIPPKVLKNVGLCVLGLLGLGLAFYVFGPPEPSDDERMEQADELREKAQAARAQQDQKAALDRVTDGRLLLKLNCEYFEDCAMIWPDCTTLADRLNHDGYKADPGEILQGALTVMQRLSCEKQGQQSFEDFCSFYETQRRSHLLPGSSAGGMSHREAIDSLVMQEKFPRRVFSYQKFKAITEARKDQALEPGDVVTVSTLSGHPHRMWVFEKGSDQPIADERGDNRDFSIPNGTRVEVIRTVEDPSHDLGLREVYVKFLDGELQGHSGMLSPVVLDVEPLAMQQPDTSPVVSPAP